jgi:hypothetical protein
MITLLLYSRVIMLIFQERNNQMDINERLENLRAEMIATYSAVEMILRGIADYSEMSVVETDDVDNCRVHIKNSLDTLMEKYDEILISCGVQARERSEHEV